MRTATDWAARLSATYGIEKAFLEIYIRAIQADAREAALEDAARLLDVAASLATASIDKRDTPTTDAGVVAEVVCRERARAIRALKGSLTLPHPNVPLGNNPAPEPKR